MGERSNESGLSRKLLDKLKLPSSKTVQENIAAFEEAVLRVDNVDLTIMIDSEKLFIFYKKLQEYKQDDIRAILYTSKALEKTYRQLVDVLIRADPPVVTAHKLNALTEEKQPCHGFAKGHCKFGDNCRFSHKAVTPPPGGKYKQPARDKYKPPPSNTVSAENRAKIGAPRGKPTEKNPEGYSKAQILMFKAAASEYTDNWQDPAYFNTQASSQSSVSLNMFKVEERRRPRLASPIPSPTPNRILLS